MHRRILRRETFVFILAIISALISLNFSWHWASLSSDFIQDYCAAHALIKGFPLYSPSFISFCREITGVDEIRTFHPPFSAVLYLPLSPFPVSTAFKIWTCFSLFGMQLLLLKLLRQMHMPRLGLELTAILFPLWYPTIFCLASGQTVSIVAMLIFGAWTFALRSRPNISAAAISLAAAIKVYPGFLLLPFILLRQVRAIITALLTGLACLGISAIALGSDTIIHYIISVIPENCVTWGTYPIGQSLFSLSAVLTRNNGQILPLIDAPQLTFPISYTLTLIVVLISFWAMFKTKHLDPSEHFAIAILTMLLITPIMWTHTYVLMIPCILVLRRHYPDSMLALIVLFLISLPDIFIARDLVNSFPLGQVPWHLGLIVKLPLLGTIIGWLALAKAQLIKGLN